MGQAPIPPADEELAKRTIGAANESASPLFFDSFVSFVSFVVSFLATKDTKDTKERRRKIKMGQAPIPPEDEEQAAGLRLGLLLKDEIERIVL